MSYGHPHTEATKQRLSLIQKKRWAEGRALAPDKLKAFIEAGSDATRGKPGKGGAENGSWKGENVSYSGIHKWIVRNWGKATHCDNLHCERAYFKRFEWANLDKRYSRSRKDWARLCVPCHRRMDSPKGTQFPIEFPAEFLK